MMSGKHGEGVRGFNIGTDVRGDGDGLCQQVAAAAISHIERGVLQGLIG